MSVNVKDVVGDNFEKILACASSRRHGELIKQTKAGGCTAVEFS
jgi:hypothetical protein